jgi:uncharacterized oxidoreductase
MTPALIEHLKTKQDAVVCNTSALGSVPLAATAVYSSTTVALHSYVMSQRFVLKGAGARVHEIAPPWVRTDLMNSREVEQAMPIDQFIEKTTAVLGTAAVEILADAAKLLRNNTGLGEHGFVHGFNEQTAVVFAG